MRKLSFTAYAGILFSLLVLGTVVLYLTGGSEPVSPSASNFGPSGLAAFRELLKANGYKVAIDRSASPQVEKGELAICPEVDRAMASDLFFEWKAKACERGVNVLGLNISMEFNEDTKRFQGSPGNPVKSLFRPGTYNLLCDNADQSFGLALERDVSSSPPIGLWGSEQTRMVSLETVKGAALVDIGPGRIATNRLIDRADHAAFLLNLIGGLVPKGGRIVFCEASFGNMAEPGLLDTLGPWAVAGWWQIMLLGIVMIWTFGQRFGLAAREIPVQRGGKEFALAVANLYRRMKISGFALSRLAEDADQRLRNHLKLPVDASVAARDRLLPPELVQVLSAAERLSASRIPKDEALKLARALDESMNVFLGRAKT